MIAASHGLSVTVLEKTDLVGGATAYAAGGAFLPGAAQLPQEADPAAARAYLAHNMQGRMNPVMVDAYLDNGPKALAALEACSVVRFAAAGGMDYRMNMPGATTSPRTVMPVPFDGSVLGRDLKRLRQPLPTTMIFGGMQVDHRDIAQLVKATRSPRATLYAARLLARHYVGKLRYGRSPRLVFGNALVGALFKSARDHGIDIRLKSEATSLVIEDGRVRGVRYVDAAGTETTIAARRGVMLATGGFPGNAAMRREFAAFAEVHLSLPPPTNTGDGLALGTSAGARFGEGNLSDHCLTPVSHYTPRGGKELRFPHFAFDRCRPGAIAVGPDGRRFVNEGLAYSDFVLGMYRANAVPAFLVCDHHFLRKYGLGMVLPAPFGYSNLIRDGYLVRASTIAALATQLGADPAGLAETVKRNNLYAETGDDPEFGKGGDPYSRAQGDPEHKPNPSLGPIERAPFYAIRLYPGDTATTRGLVVDAQARVLGADNVPIAGLYAAGPDMANPTMGTNPSGGCNIGPAITFGYLAATDMAAR
ncbi:succinate dehydrogenase/fumarate reductase flavoprotein subunit [Sphingomonas sp. UYEF23]